MDTPPYLREAERHRAASVELLAELIRTPSLSTDEEHVVGRLAEEMTSLGYDEVTVDAAGSVVGRIGDGPTRIVYDSHVDTVDVGSRSEWPHDPFEPVIVPDAGGGVIWGRGASDDKAGIASMVRGAALARDLGLGEDVTLYVVGSVQEEHCDGLALEHVLTQVLARPDVVVLGEATGCDVYRGQRGRLEALVRVKGSSCHASAPERGHNPVYGLGGIIADVETLNGLLATDEFLGPGTIAVTKIECETPSLNAVPSTATLYVDRRLTAGESPEAALAELRQLPSVQAVNGEVSLLDYEATAFTGTTFGTRKAFDTWTLPEGHVAVQAGVETATRALGRVPEIGRWTFSTNGVASMGKLGIPTIGFGPGNEVHAHTAHDQCPLDDLVQAMAWYAAFPQVFGSARRRHAA